MRAKQGRIRLKQDWNPRGQTPKPEAPYASGACEGVSWAPKGSCNLDLPYVSVTCDTYSLSLGITTLHAFFTWVLVSWGFYYSSGFNFQGNVIASWAANPATLPGLSDFLEHWHKPQLTYFCTFYSCKTSTMWMIMPTPTASFRYSPTLGLELYAPLCLWSWIWESIVLGRSFSLHPFKWIWVFHKLGLPWVRSCPPFADCEVSF